LAMGMSLGHMRVPLLAMGVPLLDMGVPLLDMGVTMSHMRMACWVLDVGMVSVRLMAVTVAGVGLGLREITAVGVRGPSGWVRLGGKNLRWCVPE
jgi:hypothetical protein